MKTPKTNKKATAPKTSAPAAAPPAASTAQVTPTTTGSAPTPPAAQAQPSGSTQATVTGDANGSNKGTKVDLQTAYSTLCAGLLASYPAGYVFELTTGNETRDDLVAQFQQFINAAEQTKAALTAYKAAVQQERGILLQVQPLRAGVKNVLVAKYGRSGAQMRTFGWAPVVPNPPTPAERVAAAAKAKATKAARGTKGKVQREDIQGNVVGVVVTPVTQTLSTDTGAPAAQASTAPASPPAASTPVTK
jgi:hypothetical protein